MRTAHAVAETFDVGLHLGAGIAFTAWADTEARFREDALRAGALRTQAAQVRAQRLALVARRQAAEAAAAQAERDTAVAAEIFRRRWAARHA